MAMVDSSSLDGDAGGQRAERFELFGQYPADVENGLAPTISVARVPKVLNPAVRRRRFLQLAGDGTWDVVLDRLLTAVDATRQADWCHWTSRSPAHISTPRTSPAPQSAASNDTDPGLEPPDRGFGRSRGGLSTTVHQLVDGHGLLLVPLFTSGQAGDSPMLLPLLAELRVARPVGRPRTRPDRVRGDKAHSSRAIRQHLRSRGIEPVVPGPRDQQGHRKRQFARRQARYLRPGRLKNRNLIERNFCGLKQRRGLATRRTGSRSPTAPPSSSMRSSPGYSSHQTRLGTRPCWNTKLNRARPRRVNDRATLLKEFRTCLRNRSCAGVAGSRRGSTYSFSRSRSRAIRLRTIRRCCVE